MERRRRRTHRIDFAPYERAAESGAGPCRRLRRLDRRGGAAPAGRHRGLRRHLRLLGLRVPGDPPGRAARDRGRRGRRRSADPALPVHGRGRQPARPGGGAHRERRPGGRHPAPGVTAAAPPLLRGAGALQPRATRGPTPRGDAGGLRADRASPAWPPTPSASRSPPPRWRGPGSPASRSTSDTPTSSPRCSTPPTSMPPPARGWPRRSARATWWRSRRRCAGPRRATPSASCCSPSPPCGGAGRSSTRPARGSPPRGRAVSSPTWPSSGTVLDRHGITASVHLDLGAVRDWDYYTGPTFELFSADLGWPLGTGGRYDRLLEAFGAGAPGHRIRPPRGPLLRRPAARLRRERRRRRCCGSATPRSRRGRPLAVASRLRGAGVAVALDLEPSVLRPGEPLGDGRGPPRRRGLPLAAPRARGRRARRPPGRRAEDAG